MGPRDRPNEHRLGDPEGTEPFDILEPEARVLDCSVQEIAIAVNLTERSVWGIIRDLRRQDMLHLQRDGRRHRYRINLDAPLLHPTIQGLTLRPVLGQIVEDGLREPNDACVRLP